MGSALYLKLTSIPKHRTSCLVAGLVSGKVYTFKHDESVVPVDVAWMRLNAIKTRDEEDCSDEDLPEEPHSAAEFDQQRHALEQLARLPLRKLAETAGMPKARTLNDSKTDMIAYVHGYQRGVMRRAADG